MLAYSANGLKNDTEYVRTPCCARKLVRDGARLVVTSAVLATSQDQIMRGSSVACMLDHGDCLTVFAYSSRFVH